MLYSCTPYIIEKTIDSDQMDHLFKQMCSRLNQLTNKTDILTAGVVSFKFTMTVLASFLALFECFLGIILDICRYISLKYTP